jgi:hypothetical protein
MLPRGHEKTRHKSPEKPANQKERLALNPASTVLLRFRFQLGPRVEASGERLYCHEFVGPKRGRGSGVRGDQGSIWSESRETSQIRTPGGTVTGRAPGLPRSRPRRPLLLLIAVDPLHPSSGCLSRRNGAGDGFTVERTLPASPFPRSLKCGSALRHASLAPLTPLTTVSHCTGEPSRLLVRVDRRGGRVCRPGKACFRNSSLGSRAGPGSPPKGRTLTHQNEWSPRL